MTARRTVVPAGHEQVHDEWHLAPAVRVGETVWCSGVLGTRPDGSVPTDLEEEVDLAFTNLAHVLAAAGGGLEHVVDLLSFHLDLPTEVPAFMRVRDRRLAAPWPAWTAIGATQVGGGLPGVRLELKVTAHL